ncbi:putative bifunctional diguanylate cyclase/phosphodiesterase [Glaciecola siphonariae]|uniref:Bifunctional diguanylate cyclase/phosphodiesterase n=1 Tax=Glaciecola siphonariae TaxID=521012 RepID=A0ABV9LYI7_9ALTE
MNILHGLLSKMLLLVVIVAVMSLAASYTFVSIQQNKNLESNLDELKRAHLETSYLLFNNQMNEQILSGEEVILLSALTDKSPEQVNAFFKDIWPRIQLSFSLSSMSFSNGKQRFSFGQFPESEMSNMQMMARNNLRAQSGILCHFMCELAASVPVKFQGETWSLSLLSSLDPTIILLNQVVGSDIGILSPFDKPSRDNNTLTRYISEVMTGVEKNSKIREAVLSEDEIKRLESDGLLIRAEEMEYYVWFQKFSGVGQDMTLMFMRDISGNLLAQQRAQTEQVIVIFVTLTFGILLFLILFSIIPISKINQLKRAIKLIGAKEYNIARYRLGKRGRALLPDELDDLEDEFRHAIDVLESYEQELSNSQKRLVRQATIDSITGLFTRNVLIEDLANMNREEHITNVAIFFLDLDGFKPVNDNLGHEAGDIMLKKIGYRLKGVVNKFIRVYRIGGDEFVICYSNYSSEKALESMADAVVELFSAPFHIYDTSIAISASIGIAFQEARAIEPDRLLRYADIAMYQAKEDGKNCYTFFNEQMRKSVQRRFTIKNDFVTALADDQLSVVFQPVVSANTREVIKLEALCRWHHPDLGHIPPPIFIDVIEESENMNTLFEWIVGNVLNELEYLDSVGLDNVIISVNLSPSQLVNDTALSILSSMCKERGIEASRIELELTETSLITSFEQAKTWIEQATGNGFKIAIDDFGAGYSSLSYLTAFPYDTVKLDRSLLNNIDIDKRQQRIVGSLTQMLHGLSVPIVAEGAETEEHFEQLRILGCDYIQGYLISRPIGHDDLVVFLNNQTTK